MQPPDFLVFTKRRVILFFLVLGVMLLIRLLQGK